MKCKTSKWSCPYHACMSDDCQREEVMKHHPGFGPGICEKTTLPALNYHTIRMANATEIKCPNKEIDKL